MYTRGEGRRSLRYGPRVSGRSRRGKERECSRRNVCRHGEGVHDHHRIPKNLPFFLLLSNQVSSLPFFQATYREGVPNLGGSGTAVPAECLRRQTVKEGPGKCLRGAGRGQWVHPFRLTLTNDPEGRVGVPVIRLDETAPCPRIFTGLRASSVSGQTGFTLDLRDQPLPQAPGAISTPSFPFTRTGVPGRRVWGLGESRFEGGTEPDIWFQMTDSLPRQGPFPGHSWGCIRASSVVGSSRVGGYGSDGPAVTRPFFSGVTLARVFSSQFKTGVTPSGVLEWE